MKLLVVAALSIMSLVFVGAAFAGIPSASTSTIVATPSGTPSCNPGTAVICPQGDMDNIDVTVTVRNIYGDVLPGKTVTVYANVVSGGPFCFCPGEDPQTGITDVNGEVTVFYNNFGGCGELNWYADCESVILGPSNTVYIASPDNNGDCLVNLVDFGNFATVFNAVDSCSDYNCDGIVNLIDFGIFATHYNHACP
jgi:hypothetical protein